MNGEKMYQRNTFSDEKMYSDNRNSPENRPAARHFVEITVLFMSFHVEIMVPLRKSVIIFDKIQLNPKVLRRKSCNRLFVSTFSELKVRKRCL